MLYVRFALMAVLCATCSVFAAGVNDEAPFKEGDLPPPAQPGEGWCLITIPATYKTVSEQVTVRPATFYMETVPAKFETKEEQVLVAAESKRAIVVQAQYRTETVRQLVKEASTTYEIIPATYEWTEQEVEVKPESEDLVATQATYKTVTEQIQTAPARRYWKKVNCDGKEDRRDNNECYCLCEAPAQYTTVTKQVVDQPAGASKVAQKGLTKTVKVRKLIKDAEVKKTEIPAEYTTLEKQVVDKPASVSYETIPAKYETIQKQVLVTPEAQRRVEVPAKFETITRQVLDQPGRVVWRKIKCDCDHIVKRYKEIPGTDIDSLMLLAK